jgi:type VII secretion integral membrane protein EccD
VSGVPGGTGARAPRGRTRSAGAVCRVTVTGPAGTVDLALPDGVAVATLLPEVAWACGIRFDVDRPRSLVLRRPASGPIQGGQTLHEAGVVDGDLLVLTSERNAAPAVVDNLRVSIASAVADRPGQWTRPVLARALRALGIVAAAAGAIAAGLGTGGGDPGWALVVAVPLVLAVIAGVLRWTRPASPAPGAIALAVMPWTALAGLGLAGPPPALSLGAVAAAAAGAAAGALFVSVTATAALRAALALAIVAGAATAAGSALRTGYSPEWTASVVVVAAVVLLVALPRLVTRSSGLPRLGEGSLRDEVDRRVDGARRMLAWLLAAVGVVMAAAVAALALTPGVGAAGRVLAGLAVLVLALRARTYRFTAEVVPLLAAAAAGALALAVAIARGPVALPALAAGTAATLIVASLAAEDGRAPHPGVGKAIELAELACLVAVIPVALTSTGVAGQVRELAVRLVG